LSKLNVINLQGYLTDRKSRFKTKKSVKKSVNNRFTTDFGLFGLNNYTKNMRCCQNKNNFIYFDNGSN